MELYRIERLVEPFCGSQVELQKSNAMPAPKVDVSRYLVKKLVRLDSVGRALYDLNSLILILYVLISKFMS